MMRRLLTGIAVALAFAASAAAGTVPFTAESLAKIKAQYAGRPFVLSLWSFEECAYCIAELKQFGKLAQKRKRLPLVLVASDSPQHAPAIDSLLAELGLDAADSWVFDDAMPERLRHAVDPAWYGEVPRTYLYDAQHRRETVVGVLSEARLRAWLQRHVPE